MNSNRQKELLKILKYASDSIPVYEMMAGKAKDPRVREALLKIRDDKQSHVSLMERQTGSTAVQGKGDRRFFSVIRGVFGLKGTMNMMAQSEYDAANEHEKLTNTYPWLKRVVQDERRHGDTLVRLKKMK